MTLEQLLRIDNITNCYILWYGMDIVDQYMDDNGLLSDTIKLVKGKPRDEDRIYIILSGISGITCRYRFSIKLKATSGKNIYTWYRTSIPLDEYAGRIVFRRDKGFSYYNSPDTAKDFVVQEIWSPELQRAVPRFVDYDSVELSFPELREVISNCYLDYYKALSSIKAVYMIVDGNTGKLYIGSAYGEDGLWGRWSAYANTFHGQNIELKELFNNYGESYFYKFKYLIMHILPMKAADKDVVELETKYKTRFMTREFGLNDN